MGGVVAPRKLKNKGFPQNVSRETRQIRYLSTDYLAKLGSKAASSAA
jgi:hypothetical protein